jgi:hypothetical protein
MGPIERSAIEGALRRLGWSGLCAVIAWGVLPADGAAGELNGQPLFTPRIVSVTADPRTPLTRFYTLVEPFIDPDDRDVPTATEWQLEDLPPGEAPDADPRLVYRSSAAAPPGAPPDLLLVPSGVLARDIRYGVRVRYRDARGNWSPWSHPSPLRMPPPAPVSRGPAAKPSLIVATANSGTVVPLGTLGANDLDPAHRADGAFPYGLAVLSINGVAPGATVSVTYTLPARPPDEARWVHHHPGSGIDDRTAAAYINGNTVTEPLTDGGPGDADGVENGTIVAAVGLFIPGPAD